MKHTLKSLLITTGLMLPTVFGSGLLDDTQDTSAQATKVKAFATFPLDVVVNITGSALVKEDKTSFKIDIGFLDSEDIVSFSQVSKEVYKFIQPLVRCAFQFKRSFNPAHSHIPRSLISFGEQENDLKLISLFVGSFESLDPFIATLLAVQDKRFFKRERATAFQAAVNNSDYSMTEKDFLIDILTDERRLFYFGSVINELVQRGEEYYPRIVKLYELRAHHKDAHSGDIRSAAAGVAKCQW